MIYSIVGTHATQREKAVRELKSLGEPKRHIYREHIEELESLSDSRSLFGEVSVILCNSLMENEKEKDEVIRLLPKMSASPNIFIIDEPYGTVHTYNKLAKVSSRIFDAQEKKEKDVRVFLICNAFAARNKKDAWLAFMAIREVESAEAIAGALWWKLKLIWQDVVEGKKSNFTKVECESIGKALMSAPIRAHRGELNLILEVEKIILSV